MLATFLSRPRVFATSQAEVIALISVVALLVSVLYGIYRHWRQHECHIQGCHRFQWKVLPGTDHVVCEPHHRLITGRGAPTHAEAADAHRAAKDTSK
jgi:hypothetical protein